jgi:flagellar assembly protein FliH
VATVIKAQNAPLPRGAAFNFDDLSHQAQAYLEEVQQKARGILAQAQQEAKLIREKAEKEGRQAGQQAHEKLVAEQVGREMKTVLPALQKTIEELTQSRHAWLAHWERRAVHLATAIAARVVRREVAQAPEIAATLLREALEMAAGASQITVRMHPADREALSSQIERLAQEASRLAPLEIVADPAISRGGCKLETHHGVIDQRIETQLARIEAELTGQ